MRRHDPLARHRLQAQQTRRVAPAGDVRRGRRWRRRGRRRLLLRRLRGRAPLFRLDVARGCLRRQGSSSHKRSKLNRLGSSETGSCLHCKRP